MSSAAGALAPLTPLAFINKWKRASLTERQTAQEHFIDLCLLFGHPTPSEDDPIGDHFAFEKGATKVGGGKGFADVWKKDFFAWEYKRKNGNLDDALHQLIRYAPALESPPLQVVCDIDHFRIHTAWTNTVPHRRSSRPRRRGCRRLPGLPILPKRMRWRSSWSSISLEVPFRERCLSPE
jgi:hypothetical protein